jgi:glycosyltransferase involved in cell wall biosynthesis
MDPSITVRRQVASAGMAARDYKTLIEATRGLDVDVKIEANSAWYSSDLNFDASDVHERVELCNDGTTAGLRRIYAESEVVVVPLQDVDFSAGYTTILEGMSMGKPVVASRIELNGDFIEDGTSGFLVPPGDVEALRNQIVALLDDPELRANVGESARRRIEEHFTRDIFGQKLAAGVARVSSTASPQ